ncbi:MAG: hypothetical protein J5716_05460 [Alphaproteobacteria bacterium]|nr:hypothetical protein [Alphaproteobacteria bacterium]
MQYLPDVVPLHVSVQEAQLSGQLMQAALSVAHTFPLGQDCGVTGSSGYIQTPPIRTCPDAHEDTVAFTLSVVVKTPLRPTLTVSASAEPHKPKKHKHVKKNMYFFMVKSFPLYALFSLKGILLLRDTRAA